MPRKRAMVRQAEASRILGIHEASMARLIRDGELNVKRVTRGGYFKQGVWLYLDELMRYKESYRKGSRRSRHPLRKKMAELVKKDTETVRMWNIFWGEATTRGGIIVRKDGDQWMVSFGDFVGLQESDDYEFAWSPYYAAKQLARKLLDRHDANARAKAAAGAAPEVSDE